MTDIESQIRNIRSAVQNAQRLKARAELQRDQANEVVAKSSDRLKTDFHVVSLHDARELREKVQARLNLRMEEMQVILNSFLPRKSD